MYYRLWKSLRIAIVAVIASTGWTSAEAANTPVTFQLNWMAGGPNAGFESALAQGFYKDAGQIGRAHV